jgi:branched-chain amino acid transport system ATP-binding protein
MSRATNSRKAYGAEERVSGIDSSSSVYEQPTALPGDGSAFALRTEKLTKQFAGFTAVNSVSLQIASGSIHALIGPNGAGKTTCFNLITKFVEPTSGRIYYHGHDVTNAKPAALSRLGLVRSFQISAVFPHLTVLENVRVALQRSSCNPYCFWRSERALNSLNSRALQLLVDVGLESYAAIEAADLSYGRKRALEIATTIATDPAVLLLDEPTAGMGHEDVAPVVEMIRRVAARRTVLMVEHNLSVVADLSDRITVLARGEILAEGTYSDVSRNADVIEAYMGTGHE